MACCIVAVALGTFQARERGQGTLDPITRAVQLVLTPGSGWLRDVRYRAQKLWSDVQESAALRTENQRLRQVEAAAAQYTETVRLLNERVAGLQRLLELEVPERTKVPAHIVAFHPTENTVTLDVGESSGITVGLAVIAAEGLFGVVEAVGPSTCAVLLITSPRRQIGAKVISDPPAAGLVRGENPTRLILDVIEGSGEIKPGASVETLGLSGTIPAGIPIGTVLQVARDKDFGRTRVFVLPNVLLTNVQEVVVLR